MKTLSFSLLASNIENFMLLLSSMEHRLAEAVEESDGEDDNADDDDPASAEMKRRIQVAKLVRRIYARLPRAGWGTFRVVSLSKIKSC